MFARPVQDDDFPRWRWLWQLAALLTLLTCALVALWQGSAWGMHWRLLRAIDALRAAGQSVTTADRSAAVGITVDAEDSRISDLYVEYAKLPESVFIREMSTRSRGHTGVPPTLLKHVKSATVDTRAKLRAAIEDGHPFWATDQSYAPMHAEPLLALQIAAIDTAFCEDDFETAMSEHRLATKIVEDVSRGPSGMTALLVAVRWRFNLNVQLARLAGASTQMQSGSLDMYLTEQVARLLDESNARRRWRDMLVGERAILLDEVARMTGSGREITDAPELFPTVMSIHAQRAAIYQLSFTTIMLSIAELQRYDEAEAAVPAFPESANLAERTAHALCGSLTPSLSPYWLFAPLADDQSTAITIAAAMYVREQGCYPVTVADLVPEFLSFAPIDPFGPGGTTYSLIETCDELEVHSAVPEVRKRSPLDETYMWNALPKAPSTVCVEHD